MATKKTAPKKAAQRVVQAPKKAVAAKGSAAKASPKKAMVTKKVAAKPTATGSAQSKNVSGKMAVSAKKAAPVTAKQNNIQQQKTIPALKKTPPAKQIATAAKEEKPQASVKGAAKPVSVPAVKKAEPPKEVKAPKTTMKTSVPYQPDYKPLDQRQENNNKKVNEPLVRYTDAELTEFRELINKKWEAAKKELAYLQGLITRKDDMGGDETDNRYMTMEDGSMSMEREQLSQMASRQITYIDHLEKALIRIENKTYGICRVTGKLIDKARLRAVPHATLSLEAKLGLVKPGSNNE